MSTDSTPHPQPGPFWREHQARAVLALRALLTPAVLRDIGSCEQEEDFARALRRLRRLQPGQTERAIWCHRVLARAVTRGPAHPGLGGSAVERGAAPPGRLPRAGWAGSSPAVGGWSPSRSRRSQRAHGPRRSPARPTRRRSPAPGSSACRRGLGADPGAAWSGCGDYPRG